ncbi:hypothetical protein D3C81_2154210 [compost metagenome]
MPKFSASGTTDNASFASKPVKLKSYLHPPLKHTARYDPTAVTVTGPVGAFTPPTLSDWPLPMTWISLPTSRIMVKISLARYAL